jgi:hypothetical protein
MLSLSLSLSLSSYHRQTNIERLLSSIVKRKERFEEEEIQGPPARPP